jgi:hypothetical protein
MAFMIRTINRRDLFRIFYSTMWGFLGALTLSIRITFIGDSGWKRQLLAILLMTIVLGLLCFLVTKWNGQYFTHFFTLKKIISIIIILGISAIINFVTFEYPAWRHSLTLSSMTGGQNRSKVRVLQISTANKVIIPLENYVVNDGWLRIDKAMVAKGNIPGNLEYQIKGKSGELLEILFTTGPDEGTAKINMDGKIETINLYDENPGKTIFRTSTEVTIPRVIGLMMRIGDTIAIAIGFQLFVLVLFRQKNQNNLRRLKSYSLIAGQNILTSARLFFLRILEINFQGQTFGIPVWLALLLSIFVLTTGVAAACFDVFRGSVLLFLLYFILGIGPALLLQSKDGRTWLALAIAPALGFCVVSVLGSWLILLNFPVTAWGQLLVLVLAVPNLYICMIYARKNLRGTVLLPDQKDIISLVLVFILTLIFSLLPVALGGLKLSAMRGNPDDANNYMAMALLLKNIPLSLARSEGVSWLFNQNPIYPWAAHIISDTRWTTSAVLAWGSQVSGIPIYRFDFAFSALCYALLVGPVFALARFMKLSHFYSALVSLCVGLGFYAQLVLDIRALSEITAFPVMLLLILMIVDILDGNRQKTRYILVAFSTAALMFLYGEIFSTLGVGLGLFFIYCLVRQRAAIMKMIGLAISMILGVITAWISQPQLFYFFFGQIKYSIITTRDWYKYFFTWLFNDYSAGPLGLSPFHFDILPLRIFFSIIGGFLIVILVMIMIYTLLRRDALLAEVINSSFTFGGLLIFGYFCLSQQLWQAGKGFTYGYPFFMLVMAGGLKTVLLSRKSSTPYITTLLSALKILILMWFAGQVLLGPYRVINSIAGYDYPYSIVDGKNNPTAYIKKYDWDIKPYLDIFNQQKPSVWISANYQLEEFLEMELQEGASLVSTSLASGPYPLIDLPIPTNHPPDFMLVSKDRLPYLDERLKELVVNENQLFVLIKPSLQMLNTPFLVGMKSYKNGQILTQETQGKDGLMIDGGSLEFYSPRQGNVLIHADIFDKNGNPYLGNTIQIRSYPGSQVQELKISQNSISIEISAQRGLNIIVFIGSPFVLQLNRIE